MAAPVIRQVRPADRAEWERLWSAYLVFYQSVLPDGHTGLLWERINDPAHPIDALVAAVPGPAPELAGIAHFHPHVDTWEERPVCYLQDLYVDPDHRRLGVGRALIRAVVEQAERMGWQFVHWLTAADNTPARVLYDDMTGGASGFVTYQLGAGSDRPLGS